MVSFSAALDISTLCVGSDITNLLIVILLCTFMYLCTKVQARKATLGYSTEL
jgi:hypothetical protein